MRKVRIYLKDRSYDIVIGHGLLKDCGRILKRLRIGRDAVVITNKLILRLYKKRLAGSFEKNSIRTSFELVPDSERAKSNRVLTGLIDRISRYDRLKEIFIVAFGGGVVGDLAGFIASVYKRGTPYVQLPTTLLAQVDSAIGGKVAIDLPIAKNLVGAFYQPRIVISDISLVKTLSKRQIRNGIAEAIKYGVIEDERLFEYLEKDYVKVLNLDDKALEFVVTRSSMIKAKLVQIDEFDRKGLRAILNYGHTIGHAIEAASSYSKRIYHGEAISIGMIGAGRISMRLGLIGEEALNRIEMLIERVGLPTRIRGLAFSRIYDAYLHDKKFTHRKNRFVLPTRIGDVKVVEDVPDRIVRDVLKSLFKDD